MSREVTQHLTQSLLDPASPFSLKDHHDTVVQARSSCSIAAQHRHETALRALIDACSLPPSVPDVAPEPDKPKQRLLQRAQLTGRFLTVYPSFSKDTTLSAQEFRDRLFYRYGLHPSDLPTQCDGCNKPFSVDHAMSCPVGGLIKARHDEVAQALASLYIDATTANSVSREPMIFPQQPPPAPLPPSADSAPRVPPPPPAVTLRSQDRGDLLLRGAYSPSTDCIIDVTIVDLNAKSYNTKDPEKVLRAKEKEKKRHYLKACQHQRRHFAPFVASTDGILGKEAHALLKTIGRKLADKWQLPQSSVMSYISSKISISLARACHRCLRGSRIPSRRISHPFLPRYQGPSFPPGEFLA